MIRTFVAEPTTLTREGLVALLSREHDIDLIATAERGEDVVPKARVLKPDVVLLAAAFPGQDGIDIARALRAVLPECRCAILSSVGACVISSGPSRRRSTDFSCMTARPNSWPRRSAS